MRVAKCSKQVDELHRATSFKTSLSRRQTTAILSVKGSLLLVDCVRNKWIAAREGGKSASTGHLHGPSSAVIATAMPAKHFPVSRMR